MFLQKKMELPDKDTALPGRSEPVQTAHNHYVFGHPLKGPYPTGHQKALLGMGCFWGAEKRFWSEKGVYVTAVGYAAGFTPNPTYEEVCSGQTGHNEVVLVIYDPEVIPHEKILKIFWESHNPTQGMRQGNDRGTQYRSGLYFSTDQQKQLAERSLQTYQKSLAEKGFDGITTEILPLPDFYFAEEYHQQYLAKNPHGYCGLGGTGVSCSF